MHSQSLVVIATMLPALLLTGCNRDRSADVASSSPGVNQASEPAPDGAPQAKGAPGSAQPEVRPTGDPVIDAYYGYRAALDVMMRSGGKATRQLAPVMTPELVKSISRQAKYYRDNRLRNTGTTRVLWARRTLVADGVIVRACYDTELARTVGPTGKDVLRPDAPTRWLDELRVQQVEGRWIVGGGSTRPEEC